MDFRDEETVDNSFWKKWGVLLLFAGLVSSAIGIPSGLRESVDRKLVLIGAVADHQEEARHNKALNPFHTPSLKSIHLPKKSPMMKMGNAGVLSAGLGIWIICAARKRENDYALRAPDRERRHFIVSLPEYRHATVWRRIFAHSLDGMALGVPYFAADFLVDSSSPTLGILGMVLRQALFYSYVILLLGTRGQTIGKWLCRVKVLDVTEARLTMKQALLRSSVSIAVAITGIGIMATALYVMFEQGSHWKIGLLAVAALLSLAWLLADFTTMLVTQKRRAIHDLIARSVVVRCAD
ncbi:MAG: RDD family protein [Kiritimatiellaeota bacterium]|nr:RDD family protein [Kiritimatiellota bacterium]